MCFEGIELSCRSWLHGEVAHRLAHVVYPNDVYATSGVVVQKNVRAVAGFCGADARMIVHTELCLFVDKGTFNCV